MAAASMLTKNSGFLFKQAQIGAIGHRHSPLPPLSHFFQVSRAQRFVEVQLFTTKNYTVKTSISAENYSGVLLVTADF